MHQFIFGAGTWIGQGTIQISKIREEIPFYTKWIINPSTDGTIYAQQWVEKRGFEDIILSTFNFSNIHENTFHLQLRNEFVGKVEGSGIIEPDKIEWTFEKKVPFEGSEGFIGKETYSLQDNGIYLLKAEYHFDDDKSLIAGKIWRTE